MNKETTLANGGALKYKGVMQPVRAVIMATLLIGVPLGVYGQSSSMSARLVISPVLSSFISDWERNPGQIRLVVSNIGQSTQNAEISVRLQGDRTGLTMTSQGRNIQLRPGSNILLAKDILDFNAISTNNRGGETSGFNRRLPDDQWELCVNILLTESNEEIPVCETFVLQFAVAPSLLHPVEEAIVSTRFPVFQWNSASMKSGVRIYYVLRITELQSGQSPQQALESNPAIFMNNKISIPTYVYPVSAEPFRTGIRYVWQVQAIDEYGSPLGDNNGKSEIREFRYMERVEE